MINTIGLKLTLFAIGFLPLMFLLTLISQNHNDLVSYTIRVSGFVLVVSPLWVIIVFMVYAFVPCLLCGHFYRVVRLFLVSYFVLFGLFSYNQSLILGACIAALLGYSILNIFIGYLDTSLRSLRFRFDTFVYVGLIAIVWYGFWIWYYRDSILGFDIVHIYLIVGNIGITLVFSSIIRRLHECFSLCKRGFHS